MSADPNVAAITETTVQTIAHPTNRNHKWGQLQFGPDAYLYQGPGDGGSGGDPPNNAQNKNVLLCKLLRINVSGVTTYTIPASNPLTPTANARGENYGWRCYEGNHAYNLTGCLPSGNYIFPVTEYSLNSGDEALVGGYVYRGSAYPSLNGYYVFADYVSGNFWAMTTGTWQVTGLGQLANNPSTFGQDNPGELYVASLSTGIIYRLEAAATQTPSATRTASKTPTATATATRTPTGTATRTPSATASASGTSTSTRTDTASETRTQAASTTGTRIPTTTATRSATPTATPSGMPTATPTATRGTQANHFRYDFPAVWGRSPGD